MYLYHYCSNYAFHEIIKNKYLRLSLLSQSNDTKEGRHIIDVATAIIPDDSPHKEEILKELRETISGTQAIGFCLSTLPNSLSQWRAYATDAQGVAIGFDKEALNAATEQETAEDDNLIFSLVGIAYQEDMIRNLMIPDIRFILKTYDSGAMDTPRTGTLLTPISEEEKLAEIARYRKGFRQILRHMFKVANYAYRVKAPFFEEEQEWRVISVLVQTDETLKLPNVQFQHSPQQLKPFRDFPVNGLEPQVIKEVILGPKNKTPNEIVRLFLDHNGFEHVEIKRSGGSYS